MLEHWDSSRVRFCLEYMMRQMEMDCGEKGITTGCISSTTQRYQHREMDKIQSSKTDETRVQSMEKILQKEQYYKHSGTSAGPKVDTNWFLDDIERDLKKWKKKVSNWMNGGTFLSSLGSIKVCSLMLMMISRDMLSLLHDTLDDCIFCLSIALLLIFVYHLYA